MFCWVPSTSYKKPQTTISYLPVSVSFIIKQMLSVFPAFIIPFHPSWKLTSFISQLYGSCFPPLLILGAFQLNHPSGGQKTHYCHDAVSLMIARVVEFYFAPAAFPGNS